MSTTLKYRPDLDGIRALAVLAVIIFHIDAAWLPGGFLGVDMFFVFRILQTPREAHFACFFLCIAVYELGRRNLFLVV